MIIGRTTELKYLNNYYDRAGSQILVVYGQKHVGKQTLLKEFVLDKPHYYYHARACVEREQQFWWSKELAGMGIKTLKYPTYSEILEGIISKPTQKKVIIIDEFQNIIKNSDTFMKELVAFVHNQWNRQDVLVILCSSSIGWIENSMVLKIGDAAYELSGLVKVKELGFEYLKEYFSNYSTTECIEVYSVLGGFPGLWKYFSDRNSVKDNLCKNLLDKNSFLFGEGERIVKEELREMSVYNTILASLAAGNNKLNALYEHTQFSRAKISVYLKNLMELELVEKVFSYDTDGRDNAKKGIYRISNHLVDFYYTYMYPNMSQLSMEPALAFYNEYVANHLKAYTARYFSKVCAQYIERMNDKNKLPFHAETMGEWVGKVGTIDCIAEGNGKTLIAGCNWDKPMYTYDDFEWLMFCAQKAAVEPDYVYLFSIERFDEKLALEAKIKRTVRLITAKEL